MIQETWLKSKRCMFVGKQNYEIKKTNVYIYLYKYVCVCICVYDSALFSKLHKTRK